MQYFLGIDLGTSSVKIVLTDEYQKQIGTSSVALEISRPHPGWSEQQPQDWWQAVVSGLGRLRAEFAEEYKNVIGIGLSGQMHAVVLLNKEMNPVCPALLWNDGRAIEEAKYLENHFPELADELGVLPMAGFTAPKILWLKRNKPDVLQQTNKLISAKDYINFKFTERLCTDFSDAAGTWLLDQQKRIWHQEAVEIVGLHKSQMVEIVESSEIIGSLTPDVAKVLGLHCSTQVVGGGGDTPVGAFGSAVIKEGRAVISLGTSANIFTTTKNYLTTDKSIHSFCHVLPDTWYQMAALLNGASVFNWFSSVLGVSVKECNQDVFENYNKPADLLFLPYLAGERTPHNNPNARGVFFGLSPLSTRTEMAQAVFEGVAFSLAESYSCLVDSGTVMDEIILAGGGSKSQVWTQIIASVLNKPITKYKESDKGPAFGAARLAMLGCGQYKINDIVIEPEIGETIFPDTQFVDSYQEKIVQFKNLYKAVQNEFICTP